MDTLTFVLLLVALWGLASMIGMIRYGPRPADLDRLPARPMADSERTWDDWLATEPERADAFATFWTALSEADQAWYRQEARVRQLGRPSTLEPETAHRVLLLIAERDAAVPLGSA